MDLKPCPFCGESSPFDPDGPVGLGVEPAGHDDGAVSFAFCATCGADGPVMGDDASLAADAWNHRARDLAYRQLAERAHRLGGYTLTEYDLDGAVYQILVVEEVTEAVGDAVSEIVNLLDAGGADGLVGQPPTSAEVQR